MSAAGNNRKPIKRRLGLDNLMSDLNSTGGRGIGVVSSPTEAKGGTGGATVIGFDKAEASTWGAFLPVLGNLMQAGIDVLQKKQQKKDAAEEKRLADIQARQDVIDAIQGHAIGAEMFSEVDKNTKTGKWSPTDADDYLTSKLEENGDSLVTMKTAGQYAVKAVAQARDNDRELIQGVQTSNYLAVTRQGFANLYSNYDPEKYDEYVAQRGALYEGRHELGITGQQINEIEMAGIEAQIKKYSTTDPAKAQALFELAERERPDGSPSLAASAIDGYTKLEAIRDHMAKEILKDSKLEQAEAEKALKESTQDNYVNAVMELAKLKDPEAIREWEANNITGKSPEELKAVYGLHRADIVTAVEKMKDPKTPEGNEQALSDWMMGIERGEAEWDDIKNDKRLTPPQQAKLYGSMKAMAQRADLGYIPDAQLASKLLADLEEAWPDSVYGTPWTASQVFDPGKPPVVTPEGLYYQNVFLKEVRQLDPKLDPQESNRMKLEILQDIKNDIVSGRERWKDNAGRLEEDFPVLKLSEKVKEKEALSDAEVTAVGKVFNDGGAAKVKDVFKVDYFALDGPEQQRIAAEAQRQKAELDALKAQSFFGRFFGTDESRVDPLEWERQTNEEAARLVLEGMELDRKLWLGESIDG